MNMSLDEYDGVTSQILSRLDGTIGYLWRLWAVVLRWFDMRLWFFEAHSSVQVSLYRQRPHG